MTATPRTPEEDHRQPVGDARRRNRLAITAASFAGFALLLTFSSLSYEPGPDTRTDYVAGRYGTPMLFALVALACGIPALLRIRRPADQDGRSWDGKEPAIFSVVAGYVVIAIAVVRIALLLTSR